MKSQSCYSAMLMLALLIGNLLVSASPVVIRQVSQEGNEIDQVNNSSIEEELDSILLPDTARELPDEDSTSTSSSTTSTTEPFLPEKSVSESVVSDDDDSDEDDSMEVTTNTSGGGGGSNIFSILNLVTSLFPGSSNGNGGASSSSGNSNQGQTQERPLLTLKLSILRALFQFGTSVLGYASSGSSSSNGSSG